jgi:glutathione S-transferase
MAYKLHYFNITGLGEPIRWILKYGNIEFEDIRYEFEEWAEIKKTMPFGQLPLLEFPDGKKINQSSAICRYFAKKVGLAGDNDLEALEIESIVDTFTDIRQKISIAAWEKDEEKKAESLKNLKADLIPLYFGKLDEIAGANGGFLACGKLTWADLYVTSLKNVLEWALKDDFNNFEGYPNLRAITEKVSEIESIKKWLEVRPKTMF